MRNVFKYLALLVCLLALSGRARADIVTADAVGDMGQHTSLATVNGNPAISYYDITNGNLMYVRATDASGTAWGAPISVDSNAGNVGQYTSLAVVNGNPAISYYDATNGNLMYVRATDISGTAWGAPIIADTGGLDDVGQFTSLAIVNGNPAISYHAAVGSNLKYVRANSVDGSTWGNSPVSIDIIGFMGQFTSLAVVNGNPAISYWDATDGDLRYVRANSADGSTWATAPITVDTGGSDIVGLATSLVVVNGNPAISYYDLTNGNLKYVRAINADGSVWGGLVIVDSGGDVGAFSALTVVNGNPAISYYDFTNGALKFIRADNANGTAWTTAAISVDTAGDLGTYTSLAVVNGNPAISYHDVTNTNLKFARACDADGTSWLVTCPVATITLAFDTATSNAAEAAGFGNLLRVTTSDSNPTVAAATVTVSVAIGSTAIAADYNLTGTITIPAGTAHNSLVSIASGITVIDETLLEGNETVNLQLSAPSGAILGGQTTITHTINNDDSATVSISASTPNAAENPASNGQFVITLSAPNTTDAPITVSYSVTGTASPSVDYLALSGTAVIAINADFVTIDVLTSGFDDLAIEPAETVIVTLNGTNNLLVTVSTPDTATVTIADNETAGLSLSAVSIAEGGAPQTYTLALNTQPTADVQITAITPDAQCTISGVALPLVFTSTTWNVPQNITVTAVDDLAVEGPHNCVVAYTIAGEATYAALSPVANAIAVADNDSPPVVTPPPPPANNPAPAISVFDPAISKLGLLVPGQLGARGEQLEWIVTVSNPSAVAGTNVVVTDTLRAELRIDRVVAAGGTASTNGQTVTVTYASIAPGQAFTFSIFTTVTGGGASIDNTACVNASNIAAQECVTAPLVRSLPATGQTPWWADVLWALLAAGAAGVIGVSAVAWRVRSAR
jgi:uncharacterized repeat protein (TIGR01451 family)